MAGCVIYKFAMDTPMRVVGAATTAFAFGVAAGACWARVELLQSAQRCMPGYTDTRDGINQATAIAFGATITASIVTAIAAFA